MKEMSEEHLMKLLHRILVVLLVATVPMVTNAADWQYTAESGAGDIYQMDFESVVDVGLHRKAWLQINYKDELETSIHPRKKYRSEKALYYFDCKAKMLATTQTVRYSGPYATGAVVDSHSLRFNPGLLDDMVPETVGDVLLNTACGTRADRMKIKAHNDEKLAAILRKMEEHQQRSSRVE